MGLGVPIGQGMAGFISILGMYAELIPQILVDINPYSRDSDFACLIKIAKGVPPADISVLDLSPTLCPMLERCWDPDPSVRPTIKNASL